MSLLSLIGDPTMRNVLAGAALLGAIGGVLGCFAVLRRQSLLGDALSHATLPGICLGYLASGGRDLAGIAGGALVSATLAAVAALVLTRRLRLKTDAALGSVLTVFFAIGVVLLTYLQKTGDAGQGGLDSFLFGQAAAVLRADLAVMAILAGGSLVVVLALWKEFKLVTFDPVQAAAMGLPVAALEVTLTALSAVAVVVGLQMVGVVLMAAMLVAPAVAARAWTRTLGGMVLLAASFGVASGLSGALISSADRGLATGPLIVLSATVIVLASFVLTARRPALRRER